MSSSVDAAEKAILYFVELLMNSKAASISLTQLAGHFGDECFTAEMRQAAGVNEIGLQKLLAKYPSLFLITGNMVTLRSGCGADTDTHRSVGFPDVTREMEAVQYFRSKLLKKGDRWVAVKSLAGHLSQAPGSIRDIVGPQLEFVNWLRKHSHIFDVQHDSVRLHSDLLVESTEDRRSVECDQRSMDSLSETDESVDSDALSMCSLDDTNDLLTDDVKTKLICQLKDLIRGSSGNIALDRVSSQMIMHVSIDLLAVTHRVDFVDLIRRHPDVFAITDNNLVSLVKKRRRKKRQTTPGRPADGRVALLASTGVIYHLSKMWGIIDLGDHEHVFFDRSILDDVDDVRRKFAIGDSVWFDAVLAAPSSRAKWKALRVWTQQDNNNAGVKAVKDDVVDVGGAAGSELRPTDLNVCPVSSSRYSAGLFSPSDVTPTTVDNMWTPDTPLATTYDMPCSRPRDVYKPGVDVACQTISTGDIVPTQFYFAE